ncbi:unnamed protein product [Brassica oleracea]|uniref:Uncharacterized protein n=2 Tax=Brassica TaxID=3705 RepID=A0A3P6F3R6_BRAOL|nr:unnamed protein product [Brassica napus]VDD38029.1 unnamed protein product [Brassica oleracea]
MSDKLMQVRLPDLREDKQKPEPHAISSSIRAVRTKIKQSTELKHRTLKADSTRSRSFTRLAGLPGPSSAHLVPLRCGQIETKTSDKVQTTEHLVRKRERHRVEQKENERLEKGRPPTLGKGTGHRGNLFLH